MHKSSSTSPPNPSEPQPRRGRPRAFDREAALVKAMRLFWAKGFEATSIADLTDALGVGTTSLYAAFGSKDALYAEALGQYRSRYQHLTLGRFRSAPTAREAVGALLHDSASAMTGAHEDLPRGCMINLATVGSDGHEALVDLTRQLRTDGFELIRARLAEAVAVGELPAALDVTRLARFLQTVQSGMAIRARDGAEQSELEDVAELAMRGWDAMILRCTGPRAS